MRDRGIETAGHRRGTGARALVALVVALVVGGAIPAAAGAATTELEPIEESRRALVFGVDDLSGERITAAEVVMRARRSTIRRKLAAGEVASAPGGVLRVRKPRPAKGGTLVVTTAGTSSGETSEPAPTGSEPTPSGGEPTPTGADPAAPASCDPGALGSLVLPGCGQLLADAGTALDPNTIWGKTDCQTAGRQRVVESGGDPHAASSGVVPGDTSYRELTVIDGDDVWGERCELGKNDHRTGPTAVFREGDRAVTSASFRLPANYPLENTSWQVVMQMKQTQPSANGGGTPVISFEAKGGRWRLLQSTSSGPSGDTRELWTAPAQRGVWTRFAFDVTYSQDPSAGSIQVHADLDGDGDADGASERSPRIGTYTLKRESEGGSATDGIAPGESIPSHLRVGIYHHPGIECPPPGGCSINVDNVQVADAG